jgi:hypothetical protein
VVVLMPLTQSKGLCLGISLMRRIIQEIYLWLNERTK